MLSISHLFALLCFGFLLFFFAGLPNLKTCPLPTYVQRNNRNQYRAGRIKVNDDCDTAQEYHDNKLRYGLALTAIILVYSVAAFWNLGNKESPETFAPMAGENAVLDFGASSKPSVLVLFPGVGIGEYQIEYSDDAEGWFPLEKFSQDHVSVLKWQYISLPAERDFRFLRIHCDSGNPWLGEVSVLNELGEKVDFSCSIQELSDEANAVPLSSNYLNSSYFDEIYHARTAWEHLNGIWPYEISHPPLGKEIISLGILLFGMTPFGWRFSGTVIGILMIPVMYCLLMRLIGKKHIAVLGTILLSTEFMHYSQTRIATIDSYAVFFILLAFLFMFGWLRDNRLCDLALSGIFWGIGSACKWTCIYAGGGLALLWVIRWIESFFKYRVKQRYFRDFVFNCLFCVLFFVLVPALIYYLSYLPYGKAENVSVFSPAYTKMVLDNQTFMLNYHTSVVAEHPYSSRWYQWILDIRPILYYLEYPTNETRVSIAAFVNPLICWGGLVSVFILLYIAVARRDHIAFFLLTAYASGLVPWMFITRLTFEYHYFASAIFLIPMLCYVFSLIEEGGPFGRLRTVSFTLVSTVLFAVFFPVLCGLEINSTTEASLMSWLPTWPL